MFAVSLFDIPKLALSAAIGFLACYLIASLSWIPSAEKAAREGEAARLNAATQKAIGELTDEADRARVNRRICIERGRVYLNASGKCVEGPGPIHG